MRKQQDKLRSFFTILAVCIPFTVAPPEMIAPTSSVTEQFNTCSTAPLVAHNPQIPHPPLRSKLLEKFWTGIECLLPTVPEATDEDSLAVFANKPLPNEDQEVLWQDVVNPALHWVFWGKSVEEMATLVQRGPKGLAGFAELCQPMWNYGGDVWAKDRDAYPGNQTNVCVKYVTWITLLT